jgi:HAD superfamily hydrolase (TIGR01509 family)
MSNNPIEAVIFDLDGVLAETETVCYRGLCDLVAPATFPWHEYETLIGSSHEHTTAWLHERFRLTENIEELHALTSAAIHRALEAATLEPMEGAFELVEGLRDRGIPVAVASQSSPRWVATTLERIGLAAALPLRVTASEVAQGKPAPDIYLAAAERLGVAPERSIAIEDSLPGIAAGAAAGMTVVQLRAAHYCPPPQREASYVIATLAEFDLGWLGGRYQ